MSTVLETKRLTKSFGGIRALDSVSLTINVGTVMGIIGPNGAGKTTLFNSITGFLKPTAGTISFKGADITAQPPHRIAAKGIGRTFQDLRLFGGLTVLEHMLIARKAQNGEGILNSLFRTARTQLQETENKRKGAEILELVGLAAEQNMAVRSLSYGQQKLLSIACVVAMEPEVFLLDEPFTGIHHLLILRISDLIREFVEKGKTIVLIEHNIDAVKLVAERLIILDEGRVVVDGEPSKVLNDPKVLRLYVD